ncbi:hypothetical protein D3C73_906430 [compost metagenome]
MDGGTERLRKGEKHRYVYSFKEIKLVFSVELEKVRMGDKLTDDSWLYRGYSTEANWFRRR